MTIFYFCSSSFSNSVDRSVIAFKKLPNLGNFSVTSVSKDNPGTFCCRRRRHCRRCRHRHCRRCRRRLYLRCRRHRCRRRHCRRRFC